MWFFLQPARNENELEDFFRVRAESGLYETVVQDSWAQRLLDKKLLRREKREKERIHLRREQSQNEPDRHCLEVSRRRSRVLL